MTDKDLTALAEFGLTSLQSRVYMALLRLGASRPSRISSEIGIARPEAYRVLRELYAIGIVTRNIGSPIVYRARSPDEALSLLIDRSSNALKRLEKKKGTLANSLKSQNLSNDSLANPRFSQIGGGGASVIMKETELLNRAEDSFDWIISREALQRIRDHRMPDARSGDAVLSASRRGVKIRMITEVDRSNIRAADFLSRYIQLRRTNGLALYMDIADGKEIIFGPAINKSEAISHSSREADLWTNDRRFIAGMHALFETLWNTSPEYVPRKNPSSRLGAECAQKSSV